ncbi:sulfatase family protein [Aquirufa ecclesiirivi]
MKNWILFVLLLLPFLGISQSQKPNIIFILTDDHRWDALGYAGNKIIQTPVMDDLAKKGTYFKNAFVTTPICAASRASIITGMYERTHQYTFGQGDIKPAYVAQSYPALLKQAGYYTGFYGKFGIQYASFSSLFDQGESYDRNDKLKDYRGYFYKTLGKDSVHLSRYTGQKAMDFIAQAPKDKPFCLSLSFSAPHAHDPSEQQYFWQPEVDHLYRNVTIAPPIMATEADFLAQPEYVQTGENRTRWHWRFDTPEKYQRSVKGYYRMISGVDLEIGKIRKMLEEKGLDKNTIIIVMGDNGYFLGERQLAGKWLMYDNSLRVPLIVYDPRKSIHRDIQDDVLNIDIAPTIFGFAGIPIPSTWQGQNLASYVQGKSPAKSRNEFLVEHLWKVKIIASSEGIRSKQWKYFRYRDHLDREELYDLRQDPLEKKNLVGVAKYQHIVNQMRQKLEQKVATLEGQRLP